jgi:hypothetical protein
MIGTVALRRSGKGIVFTIAYKDTKAKEIEIAAIKFESKRLL